MSQTLSNFLVLGHNLSNSSWSAWYCAYQYANEFHQDLLPLIDKGCNYTDKQKHVPTKYLKAGLELFERAMKHT